MKAEIDMVTTERLSHTHPGVQQHYSQQLIDGNEPIKDEWIKKMWSINATKYYSVFKNTENLSHAEICMNFEDIMLSEISQF